MTIKISIAPATARLINDIKDDFGEVFIMNECVTDLYVFINMLNDHKNKPHLTREIDPILVAAVARALSSIILTCTATGIDAQLLQTQIQKHLLLLSEKKQTMRLSS